MRITGPIELRFIALQRFAMASLPKVALLKVEAVPPPPASIPLTHPMTSVAMLLAIAAADPQSRRRRDFEAAARGLGALERLHDDLRSGRSSAAGLRAIAAWMDDHAVPTDADAVDFLNEVELRVLVELAKAERSA